MELQQNQTLMNLHYTIGLFTTNPAIIDRTINELKFVSTQSKTGPYTITLYSNDKFSFFIIPESATITFQILGKIAIADLVNDIAKVMASLGLSYTPGNTIRIEFSTLCTITNDEFLQFQTIFSQIKRPNFEKMFCAKNIDYNALKLRTRGDTSISDITFSLLSPTQAQLDTITQFNNEKDFSTFISDLNIKSIEEIINAIIKK